MACSLVAELAVSQITFSVRVIQIFVAASPAGSLTLLLSSRSIRDSKFEDFGIAGGPQQYVTI